MSRKKLPKNLKQKILKAIKCGATESELIANTTQYSVYSLTTKAERKMARDLKNTIIRNIFES